MCIRDRVKIDRLKTAVAEATMNAMEHGNKYDDGLPVLIEICLLYTSDAADERSSVDLGGRRIIKKKKNPTSQDRAVIWKQRQQ